ncbi:hypothetical protein [Pseudonocardia sp. MH-G8]|uniref:hypothetical protein n=1 Tax=Pseudonocardia sp. MH-G8 TaxID=1854588 RepID=UPI001179C7AB|nr:hypothetical protein [Pseudonocardia sp. MH-G8]
MGKRMIAGLLLSGAALPLAAGTAAASDLEQAVSAGAATAADAQTSLLDAADGPEPQGTDGAGAELPQFDPRFVEGPAGGLLDDPTG